MALETFRQLQGSRRFGLLVGETPSTRELMRLTAVLSLQGPVRVLDAGNHFDLFEVTYTIRHASQNLYEASNRVSVVRAFTCIEVIRALQQINQGGPVIILDLLATFYDDAVSDQRCNVLVSQCFSEIARLKANAPVIASITTAVPEGSSRVSLVKRFIEHADLVEYSSPQTISQEMRLF